MKTLALLLFVLAVLCVPSCSTTTTTTTTRTDGKQTVVVFEKKVDDTMVSSLSQLFVGGLLSAFTSEPNP